MSIRIKTLIIIGLTALSLTGIVLLLSQAILLRSFEALEEQTTAAHIARAANAIAADLNALSATNVDYAHWDDTYQFVQDGNTAYVESNITDSAVAAIGVNLIVFTDSEGRIIFAKAVDLAEEQEAALPEGLSDLSAALALLARQGTPGGIVMLDGQPVLISARAVLTSAREGPSPGALIMGRWLDDARLDALSQSLSLALAVENWDDPSLPPDFAAFRARADADTPAFVQPLGAQRIAGYTALNNPTGQPALILRADTPRDIYRQGQRTLETFLLLLLLAGSLTSLVVMILLNRVVIVRLRRVQNTVERVRLDSAASERVVVHGQDEIASLGRAMNAMLDALAQNQESLRQARDEALSALQLKTQILANVSHDARTPLSVILLRTEMLQRGMVGTLTAKQLEMIDTIALHARQMLFFVNNLLDEAALSSSSLRLRPAPFDPAALLREVELSMRPLAVRRGLAFETELDPALPPTLEGDTDRLKQIIFNLVGNAVKFTESGSVSVSFRRAGAAHWKIVVTDTGQGIPEEAQHRIFDSFFQVDGSLTRHVTTGVGLGLSIVRQLTGLMGGTITLRSEVEVGTVFEITLPAPVEVLSPV